MRSKDIQSITLIGMPTSGKSTIGKILAEKLGYNFIDLDDLIKEKTGKSYDEILEQDGEKKLLDLENKYTLELDFENLDIIFSPGGSIIYSPEAMEKIKKETKIIYIELPLKERGLKKLFEERDLFYRDFADDIIKADGFKEIELVEIILGMI